MTLPDHNALRDMLKQPEGCVGLTEVRAEGPTRTLFQEVIGRHAYLLDLADGALRLIHATPGAGTWIAELPVDDLPSQGSLTLYLAWSPESLRLSAVDPEDPTRGRVAHGKRTQDRIQVDTHGGLTQVGADVSGATLYVAGSKVSSPPAIELWSDTLEAANILLDGTSSAGFMYEVVSCNAALSMLVTGLETYCQERFVELEGEGLSVDTATFLKRFRMPTRPDKAQGAPSPQSIGAEALAKLVNFQNFQDAKQAYSKAYGLRFGVDLDVTTHQIERIRTLLRYRHRITHVSARLTIFNLNEAASDADWEWANHAFALASSQEIDAFIGALHDATLKLRPR